MSAEPSRLVQRASELLWGIACCDVEGVSAHRALLIQRLRELETLCSELRFPDLYSAVVRREERQSATPSR